MNSSRLEILRNAVKIHEEKIRERSLPKKTKATSTEIYDSSTSSNSFSNPNVMENLEIPHLRMQTGKNLMRFDGSIRKQSRNFPYTPRTSITKRVEPSETKALQDNIVFNKVGETYQNETDAGIERIAETTSIATTPRNGSTATVQHFITQVKFVLTKIKDENVKIRLKRLLDFLHSGNESVAKLGLSPKNFVTEGSFNTGVTFQRYLNFIATPDNERVEKPDFYMEIFGNHIENGRTEDLKVIKGETSFKQEFPQNLSTTPLRELKPKGKDTPSKNNAFLKGMCEKIKTIDDIVTLVSSIGFCVDGPVLTEKDFERKEKMFVNPIRKTLGEEYDI